jgi:phage-related protein
MIKSVRFIGSAKDDLSAFPKSARARAGQDLFMVQVGRNPDDWKPMSTVGPGACEIRVRDEAGAFRVIYVDERPSPKGEGFELRLKPGNGRPSADAQC